MGVIIFHPQQEYFIFYECKEAEKKTKLHQHIIPINASYIPVSIPTNVKIIPINWKKFKTSFH
jgi:hypothetical protein